MFFYASKLLWGLVQPLNLTVLLLLAAFLSALAGFGRVATLSMGAALLLLGVAGWTSTGAMLMRPLEDHFVRPDPEPAGVDGIIVLGGGMEGGINLVRGGYELNASGDRLVEAAVLARRYPQARVVVSGGTGALMLEGEGDADAAPRLLEALGVDAGRLVLESRSRNTQENARFTRELVSPRAGETWLLVTSAFHMPRSVGLFRKEGFDVVPWPADYRTSGAERWGLARQNNLMALQTFTVAVREWIGLFAYRVTGRIDSILP